MVVDNAPGAPHIALFAMYGFSLCLKIQPEGGRPILAQRFSAGKNGRAIQVPGEPALIEVEGFELSN